MYVLAIDIKAAGNNEVEDVIEVGAVVWDTLVDRPITMMSRLIKNNDIKLANHVIELTGISEKDICLFGVDMEVVVQELIIMAKTCDYIVAHQAQNLIKPLFDKLFTGYGLTMPWIDTYYDLPVSIKHSFVTTDELTEYHSNYLRNSDKALFGALNILEVCSHYDWEDIINISQSSMVKLIANIPYSKSHYARVHGFHYEHSKERWERSIKKILLDEFCCDLNYEVFLPSSKL